MKRYEELWLSWKQQKAILEGREGHNYDLADCLRAIDKSVTFYIQPEDEREVWWHDGLKVVVSAGVTDTGSWARPVRHCLL